MPSANNVEREYPVWCLVTVLREIISKAARGKYPPRLATEMILLSYAKSIDGTLLTTSAARWLRIHVDCKGKGKGKDDGGGQGQGQRKGQGIAQIKKDDPLSKIRKAQPRPKAISCDTLIINQYLDPSQKWF